MHALHNNKKHQNADTCCRKLPALVGRLPSSLCSRTGGRKKETCVWAVELENIFVMEAENIFVMEADTNTSAIIVEDVLYYYNI